MDLSDTNFTVPKEILLHITSFMDDNTKRQMRLANTTWFKLINYKNFTLYFTRLDRLPEITDRLSKYDAPIGVTFLKSFITKMEDWIVQLTKLTNLTSLYFQTDYNEASIDDWMKMTALSNLESWSVPYNCPELLVAKLHSLNELYIKEEYSWALFKDELPKFTNLECLNIANNSTVTDLDLSTLSRKLTSLEISSDLSSQGITKLTNLKFLAYYQYNNASQEQLPFSQLSGLEMLSLTQDLLDGTHFPKNITYLGLTGSKITSDCQAGLTQLEKLKTICIASVIEPDKCHSYLTAMTALEDATLWPSLASEFNQPWQNTTGACLSYLQSDKLTSLALNVTPFMKQLKHLSNLTTVEDLLLYEEGASAADIDYSGISGMTKLTKLTVNACASRMSLLCVTDIVSLKHLTVKKTEPDDVTFDDRLILTRLTNLEHLNWNDCTRATVASVSLCTKLQNIKLPLIFPDIDYSFLTGMKLTALATLNEIAENESFLNTLPKLTDVQSLELRGVIDENIIRLTSLQRLTRLYIPSSPLFKGEHLTVLTTVQQLIVFSQSSSDYLKKEELLKKMPFLTEISLL